MENNCGACGLCCKLLNVPGMAPDGVWCQHAKPGNGAGCCTIHDQRPDICRGYDCAWRLGLTQLRPDGCGIVFEIHDKHGFMTGLVSPHKKSNLARRDVRMFGSKWLKRGFFIWFVIGAERHLLLPPPVHGVTEEKAHEITRAAWQEKLVNGLLPQLIKEPK